MEYHFNVFRIGNLDFEVPNSTRTIGELKEIISNSLGIDFDSIKIIFGRYVLNNEQLINDPLFSDSRSFNVYINDHECSPLPQSCIRRMEQVVKKRENNQKLNQESLRKLMRTRLLPCEISYLEHANHTGDYIDKISKYAKNGEFGKITFWFLKYFFPDASYEDLIRLFLHHLPFSDIIYTDMIKFIRFSIQSKVSYPPEYQCLSLKKKLGPNHYLIKKFGLTKYSEYLEVNLKYTYLIKICALSEPIMNFNLYGSDMFSTFFPILKKEDFPILATYFDKFPDQGMDLLSAYHLCKNINMVPQQMEKMKSEGKLEILIVN